MESNKTSTVRNATITEPEAGTVKTIANDDFDLVQLTGHRPVLERNYSRFALLAMSFMYVTYSPVDRLSNMSSGRERRNLLTVRKDRGLLVWYYWGTRHRHCKWWDSESINLRVKSSHSHWIGNVDLRLNRGHGHDPGCSTFPRRIEQQFSNEWGPVPCKSSNTSCQEHLLRILVDC